MARRKATKRGGSKNSKATSGPNLGFEATLWAAADNSYISPHWPTPRPSPGKPYRVLTYQFPARSPSRPLVPRGGDRVDSGAV